MFDRRKPLPLPPMVFRDVRFEVVHVDEEPCLRADQIGQALLIQPPESGILELFQAHRIRFSDFITRVVAVPVDGQARPMRVFTLWGTLTLARNAETPEAPAFEAWVLELLMIRGYSLHFEIVRFHHENSDLRAAVHELEVRYRQAIRDLDELRAEPRDTSLPTPLKSLLEPLVEVVAGLCERMEELAPSDGTPARGTGTDSRGEARRDEDGDRPVYEPPFDPARAKVTAIGPFTVYAGTLRGYGARLVDGRELWTAFESKQPFSTWIKDRIAWYGLREGLDYARVHGDYNRQDYYLRLGAAIDLAWFDRSAKAGEIHAWLVKAAREEWGDVFEGEAERVGEEDTSAAGPMQDKPLPVAFKGTTLFLVEHDGEPYVPMRPVVEGMGLDWKSQHAKLSESRFASTMVEITIVAGDGKRRDMSCFPLRKLPGWLMTIYPNKVGPEVKEKIIAYQNECDDVLWQHWNSEFQQHPQNAAQAILPDTPPGKPLVFKLQQDGKTFRVRVALEGGRRWFLLKDLGAALNMRWGEARGTFGSLPAELRELLPSATGERTEPALSEAGLWFFLGHWRGRPNAGLLRAWVLDTVLPALGAMARTAPAIDSSAPPLPPELPAEAHYTPRDPLYRTFVALADALHRAEAPAKPGGGAVSANHGRFLAWLWRTAAADGWIDIESSTGFAAATGIPRRSLKRVMDRVVEWGLAEPRPARPDGWPSRLRLLKTRVEAALSEAGLEVPGIGMGTVPTSDRG